jgi:hypothetical protein
MAKPQPRARCRRDSHASSQCRGRHGSWGGHLADMRRDQRESDLNFVLRSGPMPAVSRYSPSYPVPRASTVVGAFGSPPQVSDTGRNPFRTRLVAARTRTHPRHPCAPFSPASGNGRPVRIRHATRSATYGAVLGPVLTPGPCGRRRWCRSRRRTGSGQKPGYAADVGQDPGRYHGSGTGQAQSIRRQGRSKHAS